MKKMKKILYPVCAVILLIAVWNLWSIRSSTAHTKQLYEETASAASAGAEAETDEAEEDTAKAVEEDTESTEDEPEIVNPWLVELQEQNRDLAGWIRIPDTEIDYPVMQTESDNDYYLTHDFNKDQNAHGAPFLDPNCKIGESENLIIYGHNMKDKTMFQNLMRYKDAAFCESNGSIEFDTPEASEHYQVVLVMLISEKEAEEFPYYNYIDLSEEAVYEDFLQQCSQYAIWKSRNLPDPGTALLTLSTCEYSRKNGRLVVAAAKEN